MENFEAFAEYLKSLQLKSTTTLRCFDRGDVYSLYQDDAFITAKEIYSDSSLLKKFSSGSFSLNYVTIRKVNAEAFFRKVLLFRHYRVEVYTRKTKSDRDNDWKLSLTASPGNLVQLEGVLFSNSDISQSSALLALMITVENGQNFVSFSKCDLDGRRFFVGSFLDDDNLFSLYYLFSQSACRECLLMQGSQHYDKVSKCLDRCNILPSSTKKEHFQWSDSSQTALNHLLKTDCGGRDFLQSMPSDLRFSWHCLQAIANYLNLWDDTIGLESFVLDRYQLSNYLRVDSCALQSLHIFSNPSEKARTRSIYNLLNRCQTIQGQRLLALWLRQPLVDANMINGRLNVVEALTDDSILRSALSEDYLRRIPDLQRLSNRLQRGTANLQDCHRIYLGVNRIEHLLGMLQSNDTLHARCVQPLQSVNFKLLKFCRMVEETIDMAKIEKSREYMVRPDFDQALLGEFSIEHWDGAITDT